MLIYPTMMLLKHLKGSIAMLWMILKNLMIVLMTMLNRTMVLLWSGSEANLTFLQIYTQSKTPKN